MAIAIESMKVNEKQKMETSETIIEEITDTAEFANIAKIIRTSFKTVADEFGINRKNAPAHPSFTTVRWLKDRKSSDAKFFGLFLVPRGPHRLGKKQIGFVIVEKENDDTYWIEKLVVLPEYRHGGSGEKLVGFAIDYIREQGGKKVALSMMNEHTVLKTWYKKLGFKEVSTRSYPHLPFTVCMMERDIRPLGKSKF